MDAKAQRIGGILGIVAVVSLVPAYIAGVPDASMSAAEDATYSADATSAVLANTVPVMIFIALFIPFVVLLAARVDAASSGRWLSRILLVAGASHVALIAAGSAAEISYTAATLRFPSRSFDPTLLLVQLTESAFLYQFGQIAQIVIVVVVSIATWRSGAFPRWSVALGALAIVIPLLRWLLPVPASIVSPLWTLMIAALMVALPQVQGVRQTGATTV